MTQSIIMRNVVITGMLIMHRDRVKKRKTLPILFSLLIPWFAHRISDGSFGYFSLMLLPRKSKDCISSSF